MANRFCLEVVGSATVGPPGRKFLMGGVNVGATVAALEQVRGRLLLYASTRFVSFASLGDSVDMEISLHQEGCSVTRAGAVSRVGERGIARVQAALGHVLQKISGSLRTCRRFRRQATVHGLRIKIIRPMIRGRTSTGAW